MATTPTPINRAPFNALVDDDGTNTKGTFWNKARIQGVLLDPVDAAIASTITAVDNSIAGSIAGQSKRLRAAEGQYSATANGYWELLTMPALSSGDVLRLVVMVGQFTQNGGPLYVNVPAGAGIIRLDDLGAPAPNLPVGISAIWDVVLHQTPLNPAGIYATAMGGVTTAVGAVRTANFTFPGAARWNVAGWQLGINIVSQVSGGIQNWSWSVQLV
jgi:hypothetical protein